MKSQSIANRTNNFTTRHDAFGEDIDRDVVVRATEYPLGFSSKRHWHGRVQLVYSSSGVVRVTTERGTWVVPPQRGVWIPPRVEHEIESSSPLSMRSLYIRSDYNPGLPTDCSVVSVTTLLRELILRAAQAPQLYDLTGPDARIMGLILDEIRLMFTVPLKLPEPTDVNLKEITGAIKSNPADHRTLEAWGRMVGASSRTLARLFLSDTGMTFRQWQQQVRLLEGLARLADGHTVSETALSVGYETTSAFIAMFRRSLGVTPGQYFAA